MGTNAERSQIMTPYRSLIGLGQRLKESGVGAKSPTSEELRRALALIREISDEMRMAGAFDPPKGTDGRRVYRVGP